MPEYCWLFWYHGGSANLTKANKMVKKQVSKISDKLVKINENFTINMYDNGFMIEVGGRDNDEEYRNAKIMVPTVEQLLELVKEATELPRDE